MQLADLYRSRLPPGADAPTIIPLERQQSILVATRDRTIMEGVRVLAQQLDRDNADEPTLRIIPLQHLPADEIAQRLQQIFGQGGQSAGGPRGGTTGRGGRNIGGSSLFPPGQLSAPGRQTPLRDEDAGTEVPPGNMFPGGTQSRTGDAGAARTQAGSVVASSGAPSGQAAGQQVRVVADARTNSIMLFSTHAIYKRVREVLRTLDIPQAQVSIEATVVEVQLNDQLNNQLNKGVQFFLQSPYVNARSSAAASAADPGTAGGFLQVGANFGNYRVDTVLTALQQVTTIKVISSPYLTVIDGKTARLAIGDQIPYTVRSQTSQNTGNVTVTQETEIKDTGIILEVTPKINANNSVSLKINQSVTTPQQTNQPGGNNTPVIAQRTMDSNVLVQSGRTILLGGLIQDRLEKTDTGLPLARSIPVLGDLFRQDEDRVQRVELVILITPRVSRQSSQIEDITRMIRSQLHTR